MAPCPFEKTGPGYQPGGSMSICRDFEKSSCYSRFRLLKSSQFWSRDEIMNHCFDTVNLWFWWFTWGGARLTG
jgi:hypothetical protein